MISKKQTTRISKFLSLVLRHQPETIGIKLDENGWVAVNELLDKMNANDVKIDRETLNYVVETNAKKRFAFNANLDKIRASQGHSIQVELGYSAQKPPAILYHGTSAASVSAIIENGLDKRQRQHVHLSSDIETALKVGQRHGKPIIFEVNTAQMFVEGHVFYQSENAVWLTDLVPNEYLTQLD